MSDPYLHRDSPLALTGCFRSLHDICVSSAQSTARFRAGAPVYRQREGAVVPFMLLDVVWRFSTIGCRRDGQPVVCVPARCGRIELAAGAIDAVQASGDCRLRCSPPRLQGDALLVDWAEACDAAGRVLLSLRDLVGQVYGTVPDDADQADESVRTAPAAKPFEGKIALVTGSGRGLGKAIVHRLAELGATVVVNSFHSRARGEQTTAEIVAAGGRAVHLWGSVANAAHLRHIFQEIGDRFGGLDFFVSNAGDGRIALLKDVRPEHLLKAFNTNVVALHQGAMLAADLMSRRGGGKMVALSSIGAHRTFDYYGCNGTAKAALECLGRYLAIELAPRNIQVNVISCGVIDGEWLRQLPQRPRFEAVIPRQQINSDEEILQAVLFLLTKSGMNGASLTADAGTGLCICEPVVSGQSTRSGDLRSPQGESEHV